MLSEKSTFWWKEYVCPWIQQKSREGVGNEYFSLWRTGSEIKSWLTWMMSSIQWQDPVTSHPVGVVCSQNKHTATQIALWMDLEDGQFSSAAIPQLHLPFPFLLSLLFWSIYCAESQNITKRPLPLWSHWSHWSHRCSVRDDLQWKLLKSATISQFFILFLFFL